jgi:hypothetical protein
VITGLGAVTQIPWSYIEWTIATKSKLNTRDRQQRKDVYPKYTTNTHKYFIWITALNPHRIFWRRGRIGIYSGALIWFGFGDNEPCDDFGSPSGIDGNQDPFRSNFEPPLIG